MLIFLHKIFSVICGPKSKSDVAKIVFDDSQIRLFDAKFQKDICLNWEDITKVLVHTNSSGPWFEDVFFEIVTEQGSVILPMQVDGMNALIDAMGRMLSGFVLKGINSTENASFVCYER